MDDDESAHWAVRAIFEELAKGWVLENYRSPGDALRRIPHPAPDVVLMDIWMPGLSGIECTERLKGLRPGLPIIMLTARSDAEAIFKSLMAGASGYLVKPFSPRELVQGIHSVLAGQPVLCPVATKMLVDSLCRKARSSSAVFTGRESEIIPCLLQNLSGKETARTLGIATTTAYVHLAHIYRKLGVHNRRAAVAALLG